MDTTTNLLRLLEDITEKHEKMEAQTKLHLDAMKTLQNAYTAFNRPLTEDDIQDISAKASIPYDIPGNHEGDSNASEADESDYTELSSTGL